MSEPLDERLRALLAPTLLPGTSVDLHQDLLVRASRRRRRRAVVSTALGVALVGSGVLAVPRLVPPRQPDSVTFATEGPSPSASVEPAPPADPSRSPHVTAPPATSTPTPPPSRLVASTVGGTHAVVLYDVSGAAERVRELSSVDQDLVLTGLSPDGAYAYTQSLEVEGCGRYNALLPTDGSGRGGPLWHDDPGWPFAAPSPEGTRIAALERPEAYPGDGPVCEGDGPWDLVVADTSTGERRRFAGAALDGSVGIDLAWSPDGRHVAFLRYGEDRGVSGQLTVLDTTAPEGEVAAVGDPVASDCAIRSPQWVGPTRLAYLEVCPDGSNRIALREAVGVAGADVVVERRALPPRDPSAYGPQDLDLDASGRYAVWADDNRLYALDLGPVDAPVRDLGIEGVSPYW